MERRGRLVLNLVLRLGYYTEARIVNAEIYGDMERRLRLSDMPAAAERILISADRIQQRVREMAAEIEADYPDGPCRFCLAVLC